MSRAPIVGILTFQGAVQDHFPHLEAAGAGILLVRTPEQLQQIDALILPGGESTVTGKFLRLYNMMDPIRKLALEGMPVWGICAGAILLASRVDGNSSMALSLLDMAVERNSYGRQLASGEKLVSAPGIFSPEGEMMPFIRAPRFILPPGTSLEVIALDEEASPVGVRGGRYGNIMATSFHPELTENSVFHRLLVEAAKKRVWITGAAS
jgi:pyridoxal 5'-phosphate synthase pdxT subunit